MVDDELLVDDPVTQSHERNLIARCLLGLL